MFASGSPPLTLRPAIIAPRVFADSLRLLICFAFATAQPVCAEQKLANAAETSTEPSVGYADQYLFEDDVTDAGVLEMAIREPPGQRFFGFESSLYSGNDNLLGDELELGGRATWRRQSLDFGLLEAELQLSNYDSTFLNRAARGNQAILTFRQSELAVSDSWVMNNTFGHQRTRISTLLHSGYRYRLPSSPLLGATSELIGKSSRLRFTTGKTGVYRGVALPRFEETGGELTLLDFESRYNDNLDVGGTLVFVDGDDDVRDHKSLLLAGRYTSPDSNHEHTARVLADDDGNIGFWTDSYQQLANGPAVRYGVFYFDPRLAWTDEPIPNDQYGAYVRSDVYTFRTSLSLGYDYLKTGAGGYNLAQSRSHSTFLTSNLRLRRNLSIGLNGSLAQRRFSGGAFDDDQLAWRVGGYTSFELPAGQARVEIFSSELNSEFPTNSRELRGIWTTFNWRLPEKLRLTNELRVEWNNDLFGDTRRDELATQLRYDLMDNFSWGVNATMFATTRDVFGRDRGFGFSTDARWNFLPNWYASVIANYNTEAFESDPTGLLARSRTSERNTFWLTVGYARASGRPHSTYGKKGSGFGAGSVAGQVFFDENLDGIRQPGEKPAAGAVVLLDGRYETRTDYQGRYFFKPVPTGEHEVTILTEELPLPWGLQDERPRQVKVGFRDTAALDFALQRIN